MAGTTYYQRNREVVLNRAKDYYENNREVLREKAKSSRWMTYLERLQPIKSHNSLITRPCEIT